MRSSGPATPGIGETNRMVDDVGHADTRIGRSEEYVVGDRLLVAAHLLDLGEVARRDAARVK